MPVTLPAPVAALFELPAQPNSIEVPAMFEYLYTHKYTGQITLHFHEGVPKLLELPPVRVKLT